MKHYQFEKRWANVVLKHPLSIVIISAVLVLLLASGLRYVTVSSDYRYFFGEENPQRVAFESLQNIYSKDDSVLITVTPNDSLVFKRETLEGLQYLTKQAWLLPYVSRVDSITNFQYSHANGDDLVVQDLVGAQDVHDASNDHLNTLKQIALKEPLLVNRLINDQASVAGINIKMTFPGNSPFEVPEAAEAARQLAEKFKKLYPGHETHLTGMVMLNDAFNEAGIKDVMTLMPLMYLLITLMLLYFLRNIVSVFTTLGIVILSILGGVGFSGWASIPITPPSSIAPTVIMTLAIAHSIHFLKSMFKSMSSGEEKNRAIVESMRQNLRPIFLTSLTTVIGFLSLNFSDTPPFHDLGNITAVGVTLAFILSVGFLPAIMSLVKVKNRVKQSAENSLASRYADWLNRRSMPIVLIMVFVTVMLGMQIEKIKINDQFVGYFDKSIQFRPDSEYTIEHLTGVYQINFDIKSGEPQGIVDPKYLERLDKFTNYMRTVPGVVHVAALTDTYKRLNKNMHGDDDSFYRLPEQRDLAAQYLLLYEMSLPYGLDLNNQINVDKSSSRVVVTLEEVPTSRFLEISALASEWLNKNTPSAMHSEATSPTVMFSYITERNIYAMLWGTLIAFTLITLIMIIALKSVKYGILSLIPNIIPATLAFGLWTLLVGEAGFSIAFVASVTLGIIVDDTVHFLSKFNYARNMGHEPGLAVRYALENVGEALISTSIILVVGFSVLMLSGFKLNFVLGALSALTISIALMADFTLLPALLLVTDKLTVNKGVRMKTKFASYLSIAIITAVTLSISFNARAATQSPQEKGKWIALSADKYDRGFKNQTANVTMTLKNQQGQISERKLRIKILEVLNDGDKSLTIFDTPRDVKGTSFLSYSHSLEPDEQWLFLPSLKRVKRISSNNKSGPFMGSEFSYEDLSSQEVDKYSYRYIQTDKVLGSDGHVIERIPVDPNSGYARQRVWIDGAHWRTEKIEFYDRKNQLLKTLTYSDYQRYDNNKWRAKTMFMVNHQTGKSTLLKWENIKFGLNISSRDFDRNSLKRIR